MSDYNREQEESRTDWIGSDGEAPVSAHPEDRSELAPEDISAHNRADRDGSSFRQENLQSDQTGAEETGNEDRRETYGSQTDIGSQQGHYDQPQFNWQQAQSSHRRLREGRETEDTYRGPSFSGGTEGIRARDMHARSKREGFWRRLIAAAVAFGLVASLVFSGTNYLTGRISGKNRTVTNVSSSSGPLSQTTVTDGGTTDVSTIASNVMPAIVQVTNVSVEQYRSIFGQSQDKQSTSAGSGIIVSQDDTYTYIATNNHVVANSSELTITFVDGKTAPAQVVGVDAQHDLAVVKVKTADMDSSTVSAIKMATLGDSDSVKVGQTSIVIGNALGYGQSVTTGVISAKEREVTLKDDSGNTISNKLIQTDAAVNPGNSGGALLNSNGQVIGIVSAKYSDTSVEGMGYAIPISQAKTIIDDLMQNGSRTNSGDSSRGSGSESASGSDSGNSSASGLPSGSTYLGIAGMDISSSQAAQYNVPAGIYVSRVSTGSPAQQAGLAKGDIITKVDGSTTGSMQDLKGMISGKKAGDQLKITYASRADNYKSKTVTVTLATVQ